MELDLFKNNDFDFGNALKNATTTVSETFNNALDKGLNSLNVEEGFLGKIKDGLEKFDIKKVASDTIDTALKSTLKTVAGVKAKTVDTLQDLGKAIRDADLKGGLKSVLNIGIDSIKAIPSSIKNVVTDGIDLILGDTFDDELKKVMTKQKNTLSRIDKKCDEFEKALTENDEKNMKKYANGISKELEKISLISETIDRGKEIVNKYQLMQNKGSTELTSIEQELCKQLVS